jgi:MFS family permease
MPVRETLGRAAATTARGSRAAAGRVASGTRRLTRQGRRARFRLAGGEVGMRRLFDLHASSIAGDTLIAVGLAGTIFFAVPIGEARANVALYLLVTMVPFALLAPLIGPLLDHVRHGRRYALAATMLGRAMLAWLLADHMDNIALYPAAFGVLVLSRAYGVARAAAVPRLLPRRLGLSQANARGSVYGTLAGAVVVPLGIAAFWFGPQWPLRVAAVIFLVGMVIALRLPALADSDPPEAPPRVFQLTVLRWSHMRIRVLTGRLVTATLIGGLIHRALYGFLLIFLAFTIREPGQLPTSLAGMELGEGAALGLISASLVVGTFVAVAVGSRLRIHRPVTVQAGGLIVVTVVAVLTTWQFTLAMTALLCLTAAISSGFAKLAVDSSIQERLHERLRATAFAHSETLLMLAFVAGSAIGLIPASGLLGIGVAAGLIALAAVRTVLAAYLLRHDRLVGKPDAKARETALDRSRGASADRDGAPADGGGPPRERGGAP